MESAKEKFIEKLNFDIESILIDYNNICNYSCKYCWYNGQEGESILKKSPNPNFSMPTDSLLGLFDDMEQLKVERLIITGEGEPALHPDFKLLAKKLAKCNFKKTLQTNGVFDESLRSSMLAFDEIYFNASFLNKEVFSNLMLRKCEFGLQKTLDNMRWIIQNREKDKPKVIFLFIMNKFNISTIEDIPSYLNGVNADELFLKIVDIVPLVNEYLLFSNKEARTLVKKLLAIKKKINCKNNIFEICRKLIKYDGDFIINQCSSFDSKKINGLNDLRNFPDIEKETTNISSSITSCFNALRHFYIRLDGNLYPCDRNEFVKPCGNIFEKRLVEIIKGEKHKEVVMSNILNFDMNKLDWKVCKKCPECEFQLSNQKRYKEDIDFLKSNK